MNKILLAGGLGYIGSHTIVELLNSGYEVVVVDDLSNSYFETKNIIEKITNKSFVFYNKNICNKNELEQIFQENQIDVVIDFVGYKTVGESKTIPLDYYSNNVSSCIALLQIMQKFNVKNFVFSSTALVYSIDNKMPLQENSVLNPENPYARTKLFVEQILQDLCATDNDFNVTVLRYFNPIGAHISGLLGENPKKQLRNLVPYLTSIVFGENKEIIINKTNTVDGSSVRDYIDIQDLATAHLAVVNNMDKLKNYNVYNVGSGVGHSVIDLINTYSNVAGKSINYTFKNGNTNNSDIMVASIQKISQDLNWTPHFTIEQSIESVYKYELAKKNKLG